jgi:hypothetical protein
MRIAAAPDAELTVEFKAKGAKGGWVYFFLYNSASGGMKYSTLPDRAPVGSDATKVVIADIPGGVHAADIPIRRSSSSQPQERPSCIHC